MSVSTYERDKRLAVFRGTAYGAVPANYYISLHSADPGLTGTSELAGNGYARVAVSPATGSWSAPATNGANREISLAITLTYAAATGADWLTATHFGVWDAASAGNFIRGDDLPVDKLVQVGDFASFAPSSLILREN